MPPVMSTMKDQEFLDASKAKLDISPKDGATLETNVKECFNLDASLIPPIEGNFEIAVFGRTMFAGRSLVSVRPPVRGYP